jgi:hypothetical protein
MQVATHPAPKPDNTAPITPVLLKEAITSVEGLGKSIREFPENLHKNCSPDWILAGLALALGLLIGLAIGNQRKKGV